MCVIIHKPAGISFDDKKLAAACNRNSDGYGFAIFDRGKIEIRKYLKPGGNSPDEVNSIMEQCKDQELFLHLRYKTVGDKNTDNCHPFPVCEVDGVNYYLMHNGTMNEFDKKDGRTDSYHYGQDVVAPLVQGWVTDTPLEDPFVKKVLAKFAGSANKIAIFDNKGNSHIVNRDAGSELGGCWVSNTYSFDEPKVYTYGRWKDEDDAWDRPYGGYGAYRHSHNTSGDGQSAVPFRNASSATGTDTKSGGTSTKTNLPSASLARAPATTSTNAIHLKPAKDIKPVARLSFCDVSGMKDLEEITHLGAKDIDELVSHYPKHAVLLILDLIKELYDEEAYGSDEYVAETTKETEEVG